MVIFGRDLSLPSDLLIYKELLITSGFASTSESWISTMRPIESSDVTLTPSITKKVELKDLLLAL